MFKKSNILIIAGVLLICIAAGYYFYSERRIAKTENEREAALEEFKRKRALEEMEKSDEEAVKEAEKQEPEKGSFEEKRQNASFIDKGTLGFLEIEKMNVVMPIFKDTSERSLRKGAGVIEGTDMPTAEIGTTTALAGHRGGYNGVDSFLKINVLEKGDPVILQLPDGEYDYTVTGKEVIEPDDWSKFTKNPEKARLILMACHPYPKNNKRILIYCERNDKKN